MSVSAYERENPRDLVDRRDLALGDLGDLLVDGDPLGVGDRARGPGELDVDMKSALVDDGVEDEQRLLGRRQRGQCAIYQALELDVAVAIFLEAFAVFRVVMPTNEVRRVALTPRQWPRHLAHEPVALAVLLQRDAESSGGVVQRSREGGDQAQCHRAKLPLERDAGAAQRPELLWLSRAVEL